MARIGSQLSSQFRLPQLIQGLGGGLSELLGLGGNGGRRGTLQGVGQRFDPTNRPGILNGGTGIQDVVERDAGSLVGGNLQGVVGRSAGIGSVLDGVDPVLTTNDGLLTRVADNRLFNRLSGPGTRNRNRNRGI